MRSPVNMSEGLIYELMQDLSQTIYTSHQATLGGQQSTETSTQIKGDIRLLLCDFSDEIWKNENMILIFFRGFLLVAFMAQLTRKCGLFYRSERDNVFSFMCTHNNSRMSISCMVEKKLKIMKANGIPLTMEIMFLCSFKFFSGWFGFFRVLD